MRVIVERGQRVCLKGTRARQYDFYELEELADGTIMLRPMAAIAPAELEALKRPEVQRAVENHQVSGVVSGSSEVF